MIKFAVLGSFTLHQPDLPAIGLAAAVASLLIPIAAWWLKRRGLLSALVQRRTELGWLIGLSIVGAVSWLPLTVDHRGALTDDPALPLFFGYCIFVALLNLGIAAIRQWRNECSFAMRPLLVALGWGCFHMMTFCVITYFAAVGSFIFYLKGALSRGTPDDLFAIALLIGIAIHSSTPAILLMCIRTFRSIQKMNQEEETLLHGVQNNPKPFCELATRNISQTLTNTFGREAADAAQITVDPGTCKPTSYMRWKVRGKLNTCLPEGGSVAASWCVSLGFIVDKLHVLKTDLKWDEQTPKQLVNGALENAPSTIVA